MRLLPLIFAAALLTACDAGDAPAGDPADEPTPRACPEGEPDCGPAGI